MNISHKEIDKQNAVITLVIDKPDYLPEVNKQLNAQKKTATLPGFRLGKVPISIVKQKVGKSILIKEIQKLVSSSIDNYIKENKLDLLGYPIPMDSNDNNDWDNPNAFTFEFEIGLTPELSFDINNKVKLPYYKVSFTDKDLKKYFTQNIMSRYDEQKEVDKVTGENNIIQGVIIHAHSDNEDTKVLFPIEKIKSKSLRKDISQSSPQSTLPFPAKNIENIPGVGFKAEKNAIYTLSIEQILKPIPAEMNQNLYDKIYGKDKINSEAEFLNKVREDIDNHTEKDVETLFIRDVFNYFTKKSKPYLPETFLKKWLKINNDRTNEGKTLSEKEIEEQFEGFKTNLVRSLIRNRIISVLGLEVSKEALLEEAEKGLRQQFISYGLPIDEDTEKRIKAMAPNVLSNQEQVEQIANIILDKKIVTAVKETISIKEKDVNLNDLKKIAKEN